VPVGVAYELIMLCGGTGCAIIIGSTIMGNGCELVIVSELSIADRLELLALVSSEPPPHPSQKNQSITMLYLWHTSDHRNAD
jgi:hypothetical protein